MNVARLLHEIEQAGIRLRVAGNRLQVKRHPRLLPNTLTALRRHKAEVVKLLTARQKAAPVPDCCHDCSHLEILDGAGPGCVVSSPWRTEWRRLPPDLKRCRKDTKMAENRHAESKQGITTNGIDDDTRRPGLLWCRQHEAELLAAGWTLDGLYKRPPALDAGLAWLTIWNDPVVTVELGEKGMVIFTIPRRGRTVVQTARPERWSFTKM